MGEVYRARDTSLKREVAIEVLPEFCSRDPDRLRRFEWRPRPRQPSIIPTLFRFFTSVGTTVLHISSPSYCTARACATACATAPCAWARCLLDQGVWAEIKVGGEHLRLFSEHNAQGVQASVYNV